jgi:hypothetical protein
MPQKLLSSLLLKLAVLLWLGCAIFGFACLGKRDQTAGASGHPPVQWQQSSFVALDPVKPTLVMLVHPQCPCSQASISELNHLMALCPHRVAASVLFLKPAGYSKAWAQTALWRQAAAIPGVSVLLDDNGDMARRFGAATSGQTLMYAPGGRLLYQGGLTGSRGHEGDNAGLSEVAALLGGRQTPDAAVRQEPVYGCPLTACRMEASGSRKGGLSWLP